MQIIIPTNLNGVRLDKAICILFEHAELSRVKIQEDIKNGKVMLNSCIVTKASMSVTEGQELSYQPEETPSKAQIQLLAEDIPLEILFENDEMLVVDKPAGMPTHPDEHYHSGTLVNAVLGYLKKSSLERAGIVHRLDKDTSGCLMVAKTEKMHRYLSRLIADRKVTKKYVALVVGTIPVEKGTIDSPLARDPNNRERMTTMDTKNAKSAITHFDVLERYSDPSLTLLLVQIVTGRTHQIRAHFRSIGHPVVEDSLYGNGIDYGCGRMFLHASFLSFPMPDGTQKTIECPMPVLLENFLETMRK